MTFGDYAFFLFFIFCILKWIWYKKTIWVMIILSTAARRGERPGDLEQGAGLIVKSKIGRGRNEDVWERDLDQGEESFKWNWKHMKSVCVCVCFLFCVHIDRPHRQRGRASVRGRETEEATWKGDWDHFRFCNHPKSSSLESLTWFFGPPSGFICANVLLIGERLYSKVLRRDSYREVTA